MTLLDRLGPQVDDRDGWIPPQPSRCDRTTPDPEQAPPAPERRRWLWVAFAAFAVGLALGWLTPTLLAPSAPAVATSPTIPPTVASTAELFTALYLSGTSGEEIRRFYDGDPPPPGGVWVNGAAAISGQQAARDLWEVTVAVDSLESRDGEYNRVALGFYVVPISTADNRTVAVGAPARVPGPVLQPVTAPEAYEVPAEQGEVAARFIEFYLEGDTGARSMAANPEEIDWFAPGRYRSVATEAEYADGLGRVVVSARATTESDALHHLEYLVTLAGGDQGWLVTEIGPATK